MIAVELFAGAGGAALGLRRAGYHHARLVEWDAAAAATLRAAGLGEVVEGDVREVDWSGVGSVDLVWASPPCQAWSSAGLRRGALDERNGWPWTWAAVDQIRPRWLVCENVPGLLHHSGEHCPSLERCAGCYWEGVILPEARARFGWVGWWMLDAADYGVPQRRARVFLVAGPGPVVSPTPTHGDPELLRQQALFAGHRLPWVSVRQALGLEGVSRVCMAGTTGLSQRSPDQPAATVSSAGNGYVLLANRRGRERGSRWETQSIDLPATALRTGGGGSSVSSLIVLEERASAGGYDRLSLVWDQPAPAIATTDGVGIGSAASRDTLERQIGRRRLTAAECATLQAFPPDYPWQGGGTAIYRQVGNAVPPPLAEVVGRAVLAADTGAP